MFISVTWRLKWSRRLRASSFPPPLAPLLFFSSRPSAFTCLGAACACASPCLHNSNRSNDLKSSPGATTPPYIIDIPPGSRGTDPQRSAAPPLRTHLSVKVCHMSVRRNHPFSDGPVFQNRRMMPGEGYQYDGGPMNNAHGQQIPQGSRLHQYLAGNQRQGPSFGPGTPINVNAAPFIPKHQQQQQQPPPPPPPPPPIVNQFAQMAIHDVPQQMIPYSQAHSLPYGGPLPHHRQQQHPSPQHQHPPPHQPYNQYQQESRGGTTYFFADDQHQQHEEDPYEEQELPEGTLLVNTPGMYSYTAPLPITHVARFRGKTNANQQAQFITPEFRSELVQRQLAFDTKADPNMYPDIPPAVEHYSSLVPLENTGLQNQSQTTYKAFSCRDGGFYCLRRIHGFSVTQPGKQTYPAEQWKKIVHGNVVPLRELLINCRAFGDSSLIFVYDYYPLAETLMSKHFESKAGVFFDPSHNYRISNSVPMPISGTGAPEQLLWSYLIQITGALRTIHSSGLACRSLDLNKLIVYGGKVMIAFAGIQDILNPEPQSVQALQVEDLNQLGNLMVALACGRPNGYRKDLIQGTMKTIQDSFSHDFQMVIKYLTNTSNTRRNIAELMPLIGGRFFTVIESMQTRNDSLEAELSKELENGRLFRLLTKMNTVLERVELIDCRHGPDEAWSETGDRFMLKLFRDYVFHQVTDQGKAWLDMAHIVQCLNKLDAGSLEKIEMVSRSGDTQIIIDYATLKRCLEKSFRELMGPVQMIQRH